MIEPAANRRIKLVVTIADRGKGQRIRDACNKVHNAFHLCFMGQGTAPSRILEYLGLANSQKDIIFSIVPEALASEVLERLGRELELDKKGGGIAFSIPITSVGGQTTLRMISGIDYVEED
ncbi:MAG: hypothetical protein GX823_02795 [Clostridiales bacterium]|nr:hypothetical protein [Clostridiales bacterium]